MRARPGRAWAAIRQSEPAALAAGVNITLYKLWAFALASFLTGVAGGLLAAEVGKLYTYQFSTQDSILLLAVVLMGGIYSLWGAVVAGLFMKFLPALLDNWGLPADLLTILFGVGILQVLLTAPRRPVAAVPARHEEPGPADRQDGAPPRRRGAGRMIEVAGLTVRFGGVTPIDGMSVEFPGGTCGLIGPNGAGKTTFFNVLSGFVRPAAGSIQRLRRRPARDGRLPPRALGAAAYVPDRAGDRGALGLRQRRARARALGALARHAATRTCWARSSSSASRSIRTCRSACSARASAGWSRSRAPSWASPRVVLLDEPAAGLPDEETAHLGRVIRRIPEQMGALVILVDHDMSLVSACCEVTAVLDFGKLIASGPTAEVLRDEQVIKAYLGTEQ